MAECRRWARVRTVAVLSMVLALASGMSACTPSPPDGRVGDDLPAASVPGGADTTTRPRGDGEGTAAQTTAPIGIPATNAGNICRGRADSFLPDKIAGYDVAASGDTTGALPPGAAGVKSAGAALVRRDGDRAEGLVSAVVFEEQPAIRAAASATVDVLLQAAGGKVDVTDTTVNGYEARTTTGPKGTTLIAWAECLNVWLFVQAPDAPMAADLAAKVHSP